MKKKFIPKNAPEDWKYNFLCPCDYCGEASGHYSEPTPLQYYKAKQKLEKKWDKMFGDKKDLIKALI